MKTKIIEQAQKDFNPNIVMIDEDVIKRTIFDTSKIYFFFTKREHINISDFESNVYFLLGYQSINYQHWSINHKNRLERYEHDNKIGVDAILAGFEALHIKFMNRTINSELLSDADITQFFGNIPDKKGRLEILKESLNRHKLAKAYKIIEEDAANSLIDVSTAYKIAELMPKSFQDPYLKKIQLALYSIAELMQIKYPRLIVDLTVSVEYQLPKVLSSLGILKYSKALLSSIEQAELLEVDESEEKAIRSASILACEKICEYNNIQAQYLDRLIWEQRKSFGNVKFHLTRTKRY